MNEYDAMRILESNEYSDLISPKELQNSSLLKQLITALTKLIRGNEEHPRTSKAKPIMYKDERGRNVGYISSDISDLIKTYLDKNGRCVVEHTGLEHLEHTADGMDSRSGKSVREIYSGSNKSGVPKIEEVSWSQKQLPDGTFERVENRMLFDNMSDYVKHKELLENYSKEMGADAPIPIDVMYKHVRAKAQIQYSQDGYDMRIDDFTPRIYKPGNGDIQLKAQTSSHIVRNKDGYTKDVTYREPDNYGKVLGNSHEHVQIHPIMDGKHKLTEHTYSFENEDVKMNKISLKAPQIPNSDVSKLSGEYMEVNGRVLEATGSQSILFEQKDNQLIRHDRPSVEQVIEESHRVKFGQMGHVSDEVSQNPNAFRLIVEDKGRDAIFVMNNKSEYGATKTNMELLKRAYGDASRSAGLDQRCRMHTAGSPDPSDMLFSRTSKMQLSDIQVETMKQADLSRNTITKNIIRPRQKDQDHEANISKLDER